MGIQRESAFVEQSKLKDYLLSEDHIVGRTKAKFFRQYGYNESNIEVFEEALLKIARIEIVRKEIISLHGRKYIIDGVLKTPVNKDVIIRTVWIIDEGKDIARFVTAYPA